MYTSESFDRAPLYPRLPVWLRNKLLMLGPVQVGGHDLYPCQVTCYGRETFDCVYISEMMGYFKVWGVWPEHDSGKSSVAIDQILNVEESPFRMPQRFAESIYRHGEAGMGYNAFSVIYKTGFKQDYVCGNLVDFITPPPGLSIADVSEVKTIGGTLPKQFLSGRKYHWSLYSNL